MPAEFQMSGRTSETLGRRSWYSASNLRLDFKTSLQSSAIGRTSKFSAESFRYAAGYLIPRTLAEDLRTNLQIRTQTFSRILRSLAESLNPRPRVSDVRPDIWNSDIRQDVVISHGTFTLIQCLFLYLEILFLFLSLFISITIILSIISIVTAIIFFKYIVTTFQFLQQ